MNPFVATLVVIGTDCIGNYISNYRLNTTMTPPWKCLFILVNLNVVTMLVYVFNVWIILFRRGVLDTTLCDKVCQWLGTGRRFSLGTPVSSTNKTDGHITELVYVFNVWIYYFNEFNSNESMRFFHRLEWHTCSFISKWVHLRGHLVSEEKIKMWKVNGRRMPSDGKSSHCLWQVELKMTFNSMIV
jgi:hypothetical protein